MMKPIRTRKKYHAALAEAEALWDAPFRSPDGDRLEILAMLIEAYEHRHFPIPDPDLIEFLLQTMENRGLKRKDPEPFIGSRGRVADVLNRTRPLTLVMIQRLVDGLKLPADVLVKPYEINKRGV